VPDSSLNCGAENETKSWQKPMFKYQPRSRYRSIYLTLCEYDEFRVAAVAIAARSIVHNCVVLISSRLRIFSAEVGSSFSSLVATVRNSNRIYLSDSKKKLD
jgi:hypothetical protein